MYMVSTFVGNCIDCFKRHRRSTKGELAVVKGDDIAQELLEIAKSKVE